jgi:hypothetical protein
MYFLAEVIRHWLMSPQMRHGLCLAVNYEKEQASAEKSEKIRHFCVLG